ncbi:hypothetical protein H7849_21845 [Alloacidobacterium dinghuense]|uniref:Uncharacterized protein n=1 Tax=Alloacidobacterium dinghuense TaxID=2763107 RepID=A0A7G8BGK0_9BACT|nr:hypothetical protein [Alloacidobacterium dinghuense]QNI31670.1 hypothetical protein H7849_21845 [Alloacidobacterium dinghuense]
MSHGMKPKHTLLLSFMLMMPSVLPAASRNRAEVTLEQTVIVNGTQIPPGSYRVQWEGTGSSVRVSIMKGKETIVTASATVIQEKSPYRDAAIRFTNGNIVQDIEWGNQTVRFDQGDASSSSSASSTIK